MSLPTIRLAIGEAVRHDSRMGKRSGQAREVVAIAVATANFWAPLAWKGLNLLGNADTACTLAGAKTPCGSSAVTAVFLSPWFTTLTVVFGVCWLLWEERKLARDNLAHLVQRLDDLRGQCARNEQTGAKMAAIAHEYEAMNKWVAAQHLDKLAASVRAQLYSVNTSRWVDGYALKFLNQSLYKLESAVIDLGVNREVVISAVKVANEAVMADISAATLTDLDAQFRWKSGEEKRTYHLQIERIRVLERLGHDAWSSVGVVSSAEERLHQWHLDTGSETPL